MDYSKAKIYQILNTVNNDVYIGSTCQSLSKRMAKHRGCRNAHYKSHYKLYIKMNELGVDKFYIELIKESPCESVEQLRAIEGEYIRQMATLNARIEGRTQLQYRNDTKDTKREYDKQYRVLNEEKLRNDKNIILKAKGKKYYKRTTRDMKTESKKNIHVSCVVYL